MGRGGSRNIDQERILPGVVNGDVLVGLEEAELPDALGADAAGGEVGDAAGLELHADVGDVHFARENGQANGADFAHRGVDKAEDDVEIVDHEVEDDIDIERAGREDAEAVRLKKHGLVEVRGDGRDSRVETLEMANLKDAAVCFSQRDESVCFFDGGDERLFHKDVDACGKQG